MKTKEDFDPTLFAQMLRCVACFAIHMYDRRDLPEWQKEILPHAALCPDNPLLTEDEADRLT